MNILFNCSEYPPYRNGGIGSVTKIVAEDLVSRGNNVVVVGYYSDLPMKESKEILNGVTVLRYNYDPNRTPLQYRIRMFRNKLRLLGGSIQEELDYYETKIEEIITEYKIDILELTDFYRFNVYRTKLRFRRFSVPTVLRVHGSESFMLHNAGKDNSYALYNDKSHFSRTDYLVSVSKFSQDYVEHMMPDIKFKEKRVIYNPVENNFIKHNSPSINKVVLYVGKLIQTKGAYNVIKAFNRIVKKYPDWTLHMLGSGDQKAIRSLISDDALSNVILLGFCNREKVALEIDNCSFACIPSYFENFSMVPLEIMGRRRSMIYTERTSGREIIENGVDGFVVNPEKVDDIYSKIEDLIINSSLRDDFAEKSYQKVLTRFSAKCIIDDLESFYRSIL